MSRMLATVAAFAGALSLLGMTLAFTVSPDAINMGVGCGLGAVLVGALAIVEARDERRPATELRSGTRVVTTELPSGYTPPSASMNPAATVAPWPERRSTSIVTQRCAHARAVPVENNGETVAALCPDCDDQLPASWLTCPHDSAIEAPEFGVRPPHLHLCADCGGAWHPEGQR